MHLLNIFLFITFFQLYYTESFYELLGLSSDATTKDIRKAFKKLALTIHPDKNRDDPQAHEKFLKINRAYEVLKDDELRKKYDAGGEDALKDNAPTGGGYESWSFYNKNFGIYDDDPDIITLSTSDFEISVEGTTDIWFLNFYSPHCSHCHDLAPTWREVARELLGVVRMGAVNCGDDWHLCRTKSIHSYPTLMLYPKKLVYQGERSKNMLVQFALDQVDSKVLELHALNFEEETTRPTKLSWLIHFCGIHNTECLEKATITKLASMLNDLVNVGTYYCMEEDSICNKLRIEHGTYFFLNGNVSAETKIEISSYDAKEISTFILQLLPDIQMLETDSYQNMVDDVRAGIINSLLLQIVNSDDNNVELRKLPFLLEDIQIKRVDCRVMRSTCDELYVKKYPTFLIIKESGGHEFHYGRNTPHDIAAFAKDSRETRVRALSPKDFPAIITAKKPWFVDFFAPWCPPCMKLLPEFRKASKEGRQVNFGTLDCTVHANLCQMQNVRSYPTAMLYNQTTPHHFNGDHSAQDILDFIQDILKPSVLVLTSEDFATKVLNRGSEVIWLVDFFAPWCGPCQQLSPEWRKLAKMLKHVKSVKVGQVDCQAYQDVCQKHGVSSYPTIRLYTAPGPSNIQTNFHIYNGWMRDANSIRAWSYEFLPSTVTVLSNDNFVDLVLKSKKAWIVDFYAPWCGHCQVFAPEFEKVSVALKGVVNAGKVNCDNSKNLCQQAGIGSYPSLRFFSGTTTGQKQGMQGLNVDSQDANWLIQHLKSIVPKQPSISQKPDHSTEF